MKQKKSILLLAMSAAFIAAMFLPGLVSAGSLEPSEPPAPTMKTLDEVEPRIPISGPITISSPGSYYVTKNFSSVGVAITISVDHVSIDLMGHTISGSGSATGITASGRSNISIRNGTIKGFFNGLFLGSSSGSYGIGASIIGIKAIQNSNIGIQSLNYGTIIKDCIAMYNNYGITAPYYSLIDGCVAAENSSYNLYQSSNQTLGFNYAP